MKKVVPISILLSVILFPLVCSYSLSPGATRLYFKPGLTTKIQFIVNNYDGPTKLFELVPSTKTSEISRIINDVIFIEEPSVTIEKGDKHEFSVDITLPSNLSYGTHEIFINIFGNNPNKANMIGVQTLLAYKVIIYSAYPGKYVNGELLRINPVDKGEVAQLKTKVISQGSESIENIKAIVNIFNASGLIESVNSSATSLSSDGSADLIGLLATEDYPIGEYTATAIIEYDGIRKNASGSRSLRIGELFIDIINISSRKFENNKINKFDVSVESRWNKLADVYADIVINDTFGNQNAKFKTQTISVEGGTKGSIPAYFDINNIANGNYSLGVILHYEDNSSEKYFNIEIADSGDAEIVKEIPSMPKTTLIIIVQSVVIFLLIVIGLIFFFIRKHKR